MPARSAHLPHGVEEIMPNGRPNPLDASENFGVLFDENPSRVRRDTIARILAQLKSFTRGSCKLLTRRWRTN